MRIEVHNGEIYDKMTILEIKEENGLNVSAEKDKIECDFNHLRNTYPESVMLFEILKTINKQLWEIEDAKRTCESQKRFDEEFVTLARLVYLINDERARIKRIIDTVTNSNFVEVKGHASLNK